MEGIGVEPPISFRSQVVPLLSKLGCNSGGCHGKASGQNGFKLSLFGFDADFDYDAIVKEGRGRRVFPAAPEQSLLLLKAAGAVPHGGGKRLQAGLAEYQLLRRWIEQGMPPGSADDPDARAHRSVCPSQRSAAPARRAADARHRLLHRRLAAAT